MVCASEGDDPKETNHTSLSIMTFTLSFSVKSPTYNITKEESHQKDSDYWYEKPGYDSDESDESDDGYSQYFEQDENDEEGEYFVLDPEDHTDSEEQSSGSDNSSDQNDLDQFQGENGFSDSEIGKLDPIINGTNVVEVDAATYIDHWNYDAVNWYTKSDMLVMEKTLGGQIIAVDSLGL